MSAFKSCRSWGSVLFIFLFLTLTTEILAESWSIPVGGNAYRTVPGTGGSGLTRSGHLVWNDKEEVHSIFFHVDRPAVIELGIKANVPMGESTLSVTINGKSVERQIKGVDDKDYSFGEFKIENPGYVRVNLRGSKRQGHVFARILDLLVFSETESLKLDYVKTSNEGMFYWGRRGPSVHLRYEVPDDAKLKYAYSEITVPEGQGSHCFVFYGEWIRSGILWNPRSIVQPSGEFYFLSGVLSEPTTLLIFLLINGLKISDMGQVFTSVRLAMRDRAAKVILFFPGRRV